MGELVSYTLQERIATVAMDDGKANALSFQMIDELNAALDQAEADKAVVLLTGRPGRFSAGFDLQVMHGGGKPMRDLVVAGAELFVRLQGFPAPVVAACTGHGMAGGALMLLSVDYRIGTEGAFKIGLNEVAIGMTLPHFCIEIARPRLSPTHFYRAVTLSELYAPKDAMAAGYLDAVVPEDKLSEAAEHTAGMLAKLDPEAYFQTKKRIRAEVIPAIEKAIPVDFP